MAQAVSCKLNQGAGVKIKLIRSLLSLGDLLMLGPGISISPALRPIFRAPMGGRGSCPHCIEGGTEARRVEAACPKALRGAPPARPGELQVCASPLQVVMATTWLVGLNRRGDDECGVETKRHPTQ